MQEIVIPDKKRMKDSQARYLTTSLFLEPNYNPDFAVYTLDGEHKEHKGIIYPSLKQLYLEEGNPIEYPFAVKYLYDWGHWKRLLSSPAIFEQIEGWREELALSLEAEGFQTILDSAINDQSYQAGKYLAERGWKKRVVGRPHKDDVRGEIVRQAKIEKVEEEDFSLLTEHISSEKRSR